MLPACSQRQIQLCLGIFEADRIVTSHLHTYKSYYKYIPDVLTVSAFHALCENLKENLMISEESLAAMPDHARRCALALTQLGWYLIDPDRGWGGHFAISGEDFGDNTKALDYYDDYWGPDELNAVLTRFGLYHEWVNPAVSSVYNEL